MLLFGLFSWIDVWPIFGNGMPAIDTRNRISANDSSLDNPKGSIVTINVLSNDSDNIQVDPASFEFKSMVNVGYSIVSGHKIVATGEGVWTYSNGYVTYTPTNTAVLTPDFPRYTIKDTAGNESAIFTIEITYIAAIAQAGGAKAFTLPQDTVSVLADALITFDSKSGDLLAVSYDNTYFIDYDNGDDTNIGTSALAAWKHSPFDANAIANASTAIITGTTLIKFKGGVAYRGEISMINKTLNITFDGNTNNDFGVGQAIMDGSTLLSSWSNSNNKRFDTTINLQECPVPARVTAITANAYNGDDVLVLNQSVPVTDDYEYQDVHNQYYAIQKKTYLTRTSLKDTVHFVQADPNYYAGAILKIWIFPNLVHDVFVQSYDPLTHTITFVDSLPSNAIYTDATNQKFTITNHPSVVKKEGDYCILDGKIYTYLADTSNVRVSVLTTAFFAKNTSNIRIYGFDIRNYSGDKEEINGGSGVVITANVGNHANNIKVLHNRVRYMKSHEWVSAVYFVRVDNSEISDNWIHETILGSGLGVTGDNVSILRNYITKIGMDGARLFTLTNSVFEENIVTDMYGIHGNGVACYLSCENLELRRNFIRHNKFALTTQSARGMIVKNNVIISTSNTSGSSRVVANLQGSYGLKYYNNVMIGTGNALGIFTQDDSNDGLEIKNNVCSGRYDKVKGSAIQNNIYTSLHWSQKHVPLEPTDLLVTDQFLLFHNAGKMDYRPKANGLLLGHGGSGIASTHDFSDNPISVLSSYKGIDSIASSTRKVVGQGMVLVSVSGGLHGTATTGYNNFFTITPEANYQGIDTYTYVVEGSQGNQASSTFTVTYELFDTPPVAADDTIILPYENPFTIIKASLSANDVDINGDTINIVSVTQASKATIVLQVNQDILVTPTDYGLSNFQYYIEANGQISSATVNLSIDEPLVGTPSLTFDGVETTVTFDSLTLSNQFDISIDITFSNGAAGEGGVFGEIPGGENSFFVLAPDGTGHYRVRWNTVRSFSIPAFSPDVKYRINFLRDAANIIQIKVDDIVKFTGTEELGGFVIGSIGYSRASNAARFEGVLKKLIVDDAGVVTSYGIDSDSIISEPASFGSGTMIFNNVIAGDWSLIPLDALAPSVLTNLVATAITSTKIHLTWDAATDNMGVTGYKVYICGSSDCSVRTVEAIVAGLFYTATGLDEDSIYYFTVTAIDAAGNESPISPPAYDMTLEYIQPPSNLIASEISASKIKLNWTAPSDPDSLLSHYNVYLCNNSSCVVKTKITPTGTTQATHIVGGLNEDTIQYFTVTAVDIDDYETSRSNIAFDHTLELN